MKPLLQPEDAKRMRPESLSVIKTGAPGLMASMFGERFAREYEGNTIREIASRFTPASPLTRNPIKAAMGTDDFREFLRDTIGLTALASYTLSQPAILNVALEVHDFVDFREKIRARVSGLDKLLENREHQEVQYGGISEMAEGFGIARYSRLFSLTEEAVLNDETGTLIDVGIGAGAAVANLKGNALSKLVEENPEMQDGKAVFHGDHGNLATGASLDEDSLGAAVILMRRQTYGEGESAQIIDIKPHSILVPPELEMAAHKVVANITAAKSDDANPHAGKYNVVVEPRLTDPAAWYVFADPNRHGSLEYGSLNGDGSPQVETGKPLTSHEIHTRVTAYFGAGWVDFRGAVKNPGAGE